MSIVLEPSVDPGFAALINSNPDVIAKISRDFTLVYVNDAVCKFTDRPRSFFIGKNIKILSGEGTQQEFFMSEIEKVFLTGKSSKFQDSGWYDKRLYFNFEIIPLDREDGDVKFVLIILQDISNARERELTLEKNIRELEVLSDHLVYQNRLLQEFSYITSHNLRSPMSNLKILLQLYEEEKDPAEKEFLFSKLKLLSENLYNSVQDLTGTVSMKGKLMKELEDVDFEAILSEVLESLFADLDEANAKVTFDFRQAKSTYFPRLYMESILLNLMTNSIKYRSEDRDLEVFVSTRIIDGATHLFWKDNGSGINLEEYGHLVFGLKNTFHQNKDSRGIGLYITKNQIESMGGSIRVESQVGEGTTFIIQFQNLKRPV
ncbi:MAG: PAS domain-containing sensor histidine kinase [Cytophagales bacterium]|nr:PAS domain-containing sensor histidine kinase [Cytophagales bacterium]